ncbi:MATE family efflux transporter [Anaerococcus sp. Marseille-Q5996]|uniref:MATE family efflux transporter n=1 Tax=Anaerococcus sp. Marseille-Q5996 TaxID=2972769 RepID=UPI0021C8A195|nr:MATE family efflux transporter [Anaerococcus sp. Marseille-Q5996]
MQINRKLFTKEYQNLFWPLLVEQIFLTLIGNFNVFLFSLFNDQMVASIGISDQLLNIFAMITNIVVLGASILIIQNAEKSRLAYVKSILKESVILNVIIAILIVIAVFLFNKDLLMLMQTPRELLNETSIYIRIVSVSIIFLAMTSLMLGTLRAFGFVKIAVKVSVINTVLVILGNSLIVIFNLGGITYIAIATLVSRLLGMLLTFFTLKSKIPELFDFKEGFRKIPLKKEILTLGIPSAMEQISYNFSQTIITAIIASLGTIAVSSKIYTQTITSFIFSIGVAAGVAGNLVIGNYYRNKDFEKIKNFGVTNANRISLIAGGVNLILALLGRILVGIFTKDPEITEIVTQLLFFQILLDPMRVSNEILVNSLNVLKDVKFPVIVGIVTTYVLVIPLSYLFVSKFGMGLRAVWIIFILDEALRRLLFTLRFKSGKWMKINEVDNG